MKPSALFEALHALIGQRVPLHIWGACGVGKSQIVAQVAADLKWQFLDVRAIQLEPVDLRGLPRISADRAEWVPPKFLPADGEGILFLDELTSAPQMTQAGCYQLVLDRKLGEYQLPDGWVVIAAGNPASERGVHFSMPRPLRNRFVHLSLEPDFEDWCQWAVRAGLRPEIVERLDALRTLAGQIRHFYKITLPWSDEGYRLLPAHFYFELTTQMREFERAFFQSVDELLEVYPAYIEQVRPELNGLFREEDYPSAEKLRAKFGVKLEVLPIPSGDDFRVTLSEEEQARVSREIDESVRQSLNRGTKDLWVRLTDVVTHMVDKLNEPESRFHASLVTNVFDLVDLLPHLNGIQDEDLNRFAAGSRIACATSALTI